MKIRKIVGLMLFLVGCGDAAVTSDSDASCDTPSTDAPTSYRLSVCFTAPRDNIRAEHARLVWVRPEDGRVVEQEFTPTELPRSENGNYDYLPVCIEVNVPAPELTFNIGWAWHYSSMYPGDVAFLSLFHIQPGGAYAFNGQVVVREQSGRRWLGYPTVIKRGVFEGYLRFVPAESCPPGYPRRRDDICWR